MARYSQQVKALRIGLNHIIIQEDSETFNSFLDEVLEVVRDVKSFDQTLIETSNVELFLRNMLKICSNVEVETGILNFQTQSAPLLTESPRGFAGVKSISSDEHEEENIRIKELSLEFITHSIDIAMKEKDFHYFLLWSSISFMHKLAYRSGSLKSVPQIIAVEVFHSIMDSLGVNYFNPRESDLFQDYIDLAMESGIIKFSSWLSKEAVRAYRNAEQNGRLLQVVKLPNSDDRAKTNDYYSFLPEGGRAAAVRDLKNLGLEATSFFTVAELADREFLSDLATMRQLSDGVGRLIQELPDRIP